MTPGPPGYRSGNLTNHAYMILGREWYASRPEFAGLATFIDAAEIGCPSPIRRAYLTAATSRRAAGDVVFLDDTPECVERAWPVGMFGVRVDPMDRVPAVRRRAATPRLAVTTQRVSGLPAPTAASGSSGPCVLVAWRRGVGRLPAPRRGDRTAVADSTRPRRRSGRRGVDRAVRHRHRLRAARRADQQRRCRRSRSRRARRRERDVLELGAGYVLDEIRINAIGPMLLGR